MQMFCRLFFFYFSWYFVWLDKKKAVSLHTEMRDKPPPLFSRHMELTKIESVAQHIEQLNKVAKFFESRTFLEMERLMKAWKIYDVVELVTLFTALYENVDDEGLEDEGLEGILYKEIYPERCDIDALAALKAKMEAGK